MGRRYLVVIDDIWSNEAWDDLKLYFPNDNTGSRILATSRLTEVSSHAKLHGFVHHLQHLTQEESWELLRMKVFHGEECPECLIEHGMEIARSCHGLPLAVVVIAGILGKGAMSTESWERVAQSVGSHILSDQNGYVEALALSYDHLPRHLKDCFLYLGGFPEDYKFKVQRLIWLWMAEGFVQESRNRSLEETAKDYVMDLIDRNLVIVASRKSDGGIKTFLLHDLLREFCLAKTTEESFFMQITSSYPVKVTTPLKPPRRVFTYTVKVTTPLKPPRRVFTYTQELFSSSYDTPTPTIRSLWALNTTSLLSIECPWYSSFKLLRVLHLERIKLINFDQRIESLVHLRYLTTWYCNDFPSSICNLWSLQTLVFQSSSGSLKLPKAISKLVNLRHLWSDKVICWPSIVKPMNLQTISLVRSRDGKGNLLKCFPGIKKLACSLSPRENNNFKSLAYLETLVLRWYDSPRIDFQKNPIMFPETLKKLTLAWCRLPWSGMSIIQSLPNLEVLKLQDEAFEGPRWDTGEKPFRRLKFLTLQTLDIQQWEASNVNFPCLERLVMEWCVDLEEIPLEIGDIPTLELIECKNMRESVVESLDRIREDQHDVGNDVLKIHVYHTLES